MTPSPLPKRINTPLFCLAISLATIAVYWQMAGHQFINFDDPTYLTENPHVRAGLSWNGLLWATTTAHASNWHPLTWLSHMADWQFFGMEAGRHHMVSLFFHLLNTILLFLFLNKATGRSGPSGFVSSLFALHPLHVESVAWAAERKDILSTFFLLLILLAYLSQVRKPRPAQYILICLLFICGLMSKPMLVTLPFLLLLLDIWPLNRVSLAQHSTKILKDFKPLLKEKLPLFFLAALSSLITMVVQSQSGAVKPLEMIPMSQRLSNALLSYVVYLKKAFWPTDLAIFYPYPDKIPVWQSIAAFLLLTAVSFLVLGQVKKRPFLAVGWFWYLGLLVPVIGLVQVGTQAMADRYTYVPLIGLFIMIAWGMTEISNNRSVPIWGATFATLACFGLLTWKQVSYWQDSVHLFSHALKVTHSNPTAHNYLAKALADQGRTEEAEKQYREALQISPNYSEALANLGVILAGQGKSDQALLYFSRALSFDRNNPKIFNNIGNIYKSRGDYSTALLQYEKAVAESPESIETLFNLANTLEKLDRFQEAIDFYQKTIDLSPDMPEAYNGLGVALARDGQLQKAIPHFNKAVKLRPDYRQAQENLDLARTTVGIDR